VARFLVEFIRINPRIYWGMSNAQVASLGSIVAGIVVVAAARWYAAKKPLTSEVSAVEAKA
jgi:phosphatidylglycerol---prolipoprotein diacylglyceryl transferase